MSSSCASLIEVSLVKDFIPKFIEEDVVVSLYQFSSFPKGHLTRATRYGAERDVDGATINRGPT